MSTVIITEFTPSEAYKADPSCINEGMALISGCEGVVAYVGSTVDFANTLSFSIPPGTTMVSVSKVAMLLTPSKVPPSVHPPSPHSPPLGTVATTPEAFLAVVNDAELYPRILKAMEVTRVGEIEHFFFVPVSDPFKALVGPVTEITSAFSPLSCSPLPSLTIHCHFTPAASSHS
jgi:hypothetical protein